MALAKARSLIHRIGTGCLANLSYKLFALAIAVLLHVYLVLQPLRWIPSFPERTPPACTP